MAGVYKAFRRSARPYLQLFANVLCKVNLSQAYLRKSTNFRSTITLQKCKIMKNTAIFAKSFPFNFAKEKSSQALNQRSFQIFLLNYSGVHPLKCPLLHPLAKSRIFKSSFRHDNDAWKPKTSRPSRIWRGATFTNGADCCRYLKKTRGHCSATSRRSHLTLLRI